MIMIPSTSPSTSIQPDPPLFRSELDPDPRPDVFTDRVVNEPEGRTCQMSHMVEHSVQSEDSIWRQYLDPLPS
jgi:hypothetical protein